VLSGTVEAFDNLGKFYVFDLTRPQPKDAQPMTARALKRVWKAPHPAPPPRLKLR
jgi:hypothetical protein